MSDDTKGPLVAPSPRILQILGTASNLSEMPTLPGAEMWASGNPRIYRIKCPRVLEDWTRWFNMHSHRHMTATYPSGYEWYSKQTKPIYLQEAFPDIPAAIRFPRDEIQSFFSPSPGELERFFIFTGGWMMALAVWEHLTLAPIAQIQLWGFEMKRDRHYDYERPAMHYWIGRARQAGIQVTIPEGVDLCRTPTIYGYETT